MSRHDPAGLGRGPLTRWLPVLWQAPAQPPSSVPFWVGPGTTARGFLLQVLLSACRSTVPGALASVVEHVSSALMMVVVGLAVDRALAVGDLTALLGWLGVLALVGTARVVAARLSQQLAAHATQLAQHRLRATLSGTVLHPVGGTGRGPDGGVVSLMTNDVGRVAMLGLVVHPVGEIATIAFIAVSLLLISWPLGVAVLAGAPLVVWVMGLLSRRYAQSNRAYQAELTVSVARAADLVTGYRLLKGLRAEAEATARYRRSSQQALGAALRTSDALGRFLAASGSVSGVFVVAVAALAGWYAVAGQLSVGGLITAVGLAQALLPQMQFITRNAVPALAAASASAGRLLEVLQPAERADPAERAEPAEPARSAGAGGGPAGVPTIELVLGGRSVLTVRPGETVGLRTDDRTAASTIGAATDPVAGAGIGLHLDGSPAERLPRERYRSQVTVSPHDAMLFSGTVADNLAPRGATATDAGERTARLERALRAAACEDFVDVGAGGLQTQVGEMGGRLSGGQRQRLALARALADEAPVLFLHDPTTAVDSLTEDRIASRVRAARRGRTTVLITSSPALLAGCDRVVDLAPPPAGEALVAVAGTGWSDPGRIR